MWDATNHFLDDRDHVEKANVHQPNSCDTTIAGQVGEQEIDRQDGQDNAAADNGQDTSETQLNREEELDYGHDNLIRDDDEDESGWVDDNEDMEFFIGDGDMLGAEDGESAYGDAGDLGFGDL